MNTVTVKNFQDGIASDIYEGGTGEFSIAKHFDILTYPNRLQPLRGMTADTTGTGIGNIQLFSDGLFYGVGLNGSASRLWQKSGVTNTDVWQHIPNTDQLGGSAPAYPLLVEYVDVGTAPATDKTIFWAMAGSIIRSNKLGASSASSGSGDALSFTNIGQGFVHPGDKTLYIPYDNKIATYVLSTTLNTAQFTIPLQYQIPCLTNYGNYLAIPAYTSNGVGVNGSILFLWDRNLSNTLPNESINWGAGQLKVMNNLNGVLIGISQSLLGQDQTSISIKEYSGGTEPILIKELISQHFAGSSTPTVTINPNVNFVYKNRMYFSVNIVPNDGLSQAFYGLWSVGKNKINGRYTVTLERMATNDGSDTGVLAAAVNGDYFVMCHTAVGTMTYSTYGATSASTYGATSVYESTVNPSMGTNRYTRLHPLVSKQLMTFAVHTLPLTTGQQVVGKFRVDSQSSSDWVTAFTKTSTSPVLPIPELTVHEQVKDANGNAFTAGRNFEFRLESTGGAVITGFTYTYDTNKTNLGEKL